MKVKDKSQPAFVVSAYQGIAFAYGKLGDIDESIRFYKKALIAEDATTYYNLGIAYIRKGDKKEAITYLRKALKINTNLMSIYPTLIGTYQELGMKKKAD